MPQLPLLAKMAISGGVDNQGRTVCGNLHLFNLDVGTTNEEPAWTPETTEDKQDAAKFIDDVNGGFLKPHKVREARKTEIGFSRL